MKDQKRKLFTYDVLSKGRMFCFYIYRGKKTTLLAIEKKIGFVAYMVEKTNSLHIGKENQLY